MLLSVIAIITFAVLAIKIYLLAIRSFCVSKVCLVGKVALVTGGSSGIGYQIVLDLASRGCKVIIADKNVEPSVKDAIFEETNNPNIVLKFVDLASFASIRKLAEELRNSEEKLDILMNNAGVGYAVDIRTEDGVNMCMQVNYFSAFLLTHLLVELLKKSEQARVVFTTSGLSFLHMLSAEKLKGIDVAEKQKWLSYANSKFCQMAASGIFAEKLKKYNITSNTFHPWIAKTDIFNRSLHESLSFWNIPIFLLNVLALIAGKTPEEAAQTGIYLACAKEVQNVSGEFFSECVPVIKPWGSNDSQLCSAIWECSEKTVQLKLTEKL